MSNEGYLREISELNDRLTAAHKERQRHEQKWMDYERDFILPCFDLATSAGIDLHALVMQGGGNCVVKLVRELTRQRDAAQRQLTRALPDHQVVIDFLCENFRDDGAEGETVHAACAIIERLSAERDEWRRRAETSGSTIAALLEAPKES